MKGAIYSRVSTEIQDFSRQTAEILEYAQRNNIEIVKIYEEKESGFMNERPQFLKLCELTKDDIDIVLVYELSRLSRKSIFLQKTVEDFSEKGINIYSIKENLFTLKPNGEPDPTTQLVIAVVATMAQQEAATMKARSISGKDFKIIHEGKAYTPNAAYGYIYDKSTKTLIVDKERANMVRKIFRMSINGMTTEAIGLQLETMGYYPKHGTKWNHASISGILRRESYTGIYNYKGHSVKIPKIISKKMFEESKKKIYERINGIKANVINDRLLRGLIICPYCGKKYTYAHPANSYTCCHRSKTALNQCKANRALTATTTDHLVWNVFNTVCQNYNYEKRKEAIISELTVKIREKRKLIKEYKNLILNRKEEIEASYIIANKIKERYPDDTEMQKHINQKITTIEHKIKAITAYIDGMKREIRSYSIRKKATLTEEIIKKDFIERKNLLKDTIERIIPYKFDNCAIVMVYFYTGETYSIFIERRGGHAYYSIFDNSIVRFNLPKEISVNGSSELSYTILAQYIDIFNETDLGTYNIDSFRDLLKSKNKLILLRKKDIVKDSSDYLFKEMSKA